jgi:biopolymer transport protein ExbD
VQLRKRTPKKARIEIVPMIDTIFFLLVFFMVSTLSMSEFRGVEVNLPKAASGRDTPAESAMITVTRDGRIHVGKEPVEPGALRQALKRQLDKNSDLLVIINADEGVPHGQVVEIMDEARSAGIRKLSIAVKPKQALP